jgi:hypothetical protein
VQITGTSSGKTCERSEPKEQQHGGGYNSYLWSTVPGEEQQHLGGKTGVKQLYLEVSGEQQQQMSG